LTAEAIDPQSAAAQDRRWLRWGLILLVVALVLPCLLIGGVLLAARQPGGFEVGSQALMFAAEWQPDQFVARLDRRDLSHGVCYYQETLTLLFDPLEVRRVPGCQCVVAGPDHRYQLMDCAPQ
jgi:hypothetical protein